jgi:tetratricopeptide (TPR) repeat protein
MQNMKEVGVQKKWLVESDYWHAIHSTDINDRVDALLELAYLAACRHNYFQALTLSEVAYETYADLGPKVSLPKLGRIEGCLGHCLGELKRYPEAAEHFGKAADIFLEIGFEDATHFRQQESDSWYLAGQYQKARNAALKAIDEASPEISQSDIAWCYAHAGSSLQKMKRWEESLKYFEEARAMYLRDNNLGPVAHCDEEIALGHIWLGNGELAVKYAQKAIDYAISAKDDIHLAWGTARLGLAKKTIGDFDEALKHYREAKKLLLAQPNPSWNHLLKLERQIASALRKSDRIAEAQEISRRIRTISEILSD